MKKDYTDITIVLDRSGSMTDREKDVIGGFDTLVKDQQKVKGKATLSLIQFDNEYEVNYTAKDIQDVSSLKGKYHPRGATALLDAIGKTIIRTGERLSALDENERPSKVIVTIFTDGYENASKEYNNAQVKKMIKHQTDAYNWQVVFVGGSIDAVAEGATLGLNASSTLSYNNTVGGTNAAYRSLSSNLTSYRIGSSNSVSFDEEERKLVKSVE